MAEEVAEAASDTPVKRLTTSAGLDTESRAMDEKHPDVQQKLCSGEWDAHLPRGPARPLDHPHGAMSQPGRELPRGTACGHALGVRTFVRAMDALWHPHCFVCAHCREPFPQGRFHVREGKPYCAADFAALFGPRCAACKKPVEGGLQAGAEAWHRDCFKCSACGAPMDAGVRFARGPAGELLCAKDALVALGTPCSGCGEAITGEMFRALEACWHKHCFRCWGCKRELADGQFVPYEGRSFCTKCYAEECTEQLDCAACGERIRGAHASLFERPYHSGCVACAECRQTLAVDAAAYVFEGAIFCEEHYRARLPRCTGCGKVVETEHLCVNHGELRHAHCLNCFVCDTALEAEGAFLRAGFVVCDEHSTGDLPEEKQREMEAAAARASGKRAVLREWLGRRRLGQYLDVLAKSGVDSVKAVSELTEEGLRATGVKPRHLRRFLEDAPRVKGSPEAVAPSGAAGGALAAAERAGPAHSPTGLQVTGAALPLRSSAGARRKRTAHLGGRVGTRTARSARHSAGQARRAKHG